MLYFDNQSQTYHSSLVDIPHGFGTKALGDGTKISNLQSFFAHNTIQYDSIVVPKQSHSTNVAVITKENTAIDRLTTIEDADALVTSQSGTVLTVVTADCVPIVYSDAQAGVIGISHGGWKGTLHRIASQVIAKMEEKGAQRNHIVAAIGAAIGDCCYEIYGERLGLFEQAFGRRVITERTGKTFLNLIKANHLLLQQAGIDTAHIDFFPFCTSCQKDSFWSYHRDKKLDGEMITYCMMP